MSQFKQLSSISTTWIIIGAAVIFVLCGLVSVGALLLVSNEPEQVVSLPTLAPTAVVQAQPTAIPTPTPTPEPLGATITAPIDGDVVDLGQPVALVVTATDPVGVRIVTLSSNGQTIGSFRGIEETTLDINQEWIPTYAGAHQIVARVTSRDGSTYFTEPVNIKVIDREMLARNAPIWAKVEGNVTAMRGLAPLEPVEPTLLSRTELRQRLQAEFFYTEEDAHKDVLVLSAFDFVPRNFDLYRLSRQYLGENIAGLYDPATKEFVIVSDDNEVDALEQWIHAHEFMHALQDQHFQLDLITDTSLGFEGSLTIRALAEGEAEFVQEKYIDQDYFTQSELVDIFNLANRAQRLSGGGDYFPDVLVNSFWFPYTTGRDFAETVYQRNGWNGLNDAWQNLPQSTEQIIHPDRYFAGDAPQIVALSPLTDTLGVGWIQLDEEVFGEFFLREYLLQRLDEGEVNVAATGWDGDRFAVYWHEERDELVMILRSAWDSQADSNQFLSGYTSYADRQFGPQGQAQPDGSTCWQAIEVVCLYQLGAETIIVRAPSLELAALVAGEHLP